MRSVEVEGGSIDEAIDRALQALGATRDQVEIDILENATRGLLGFGRRRARVRATIRAPFILDAGDDAASATTAAAAAVAERRTDDTREAERRPRSSGCGPIESAAAASARFDGATFITEVLRRMQLPSHVSATDGPSGHALTIESADAEVIAACRDEVLAALEFLLNRVAERHADDKTRFRVALAGRGGRTNIRALARRLAGKARARRKPVTFNARDDEERRVLLEALRGERGVTVRTSGGDLQRRLVIIPGERRRGGGETER